MAEQIAGSAGETKSTATHQPALNERARHFQHQLPKAIRKIEEIVLLRRYQRAVAGAKRGRLRSLSDIADAFDMHDDDHVVARRLRDLGSRAPHSLRRGAHIGDPDPADPPVPDVAGKIAP